MDVMKEDMGEVEVTEEDAEDRSNWRWKIRCGDPWWEKAERRRILVVLVFCLFKKNYIGKFYALHSHPNYDI